ncbi:MAG: hypothetical protein Q3979_04800 [Actinomycetaceae bacterium]|nr:hypothetical protein [Actinomycetaceae bacterium]
MSASEVVVLRSSTGSGAGERDLPTISDLIHAAVDTAFEIPTDDVLWVSPGGDDAATGTREAPFRTVGRAAGTSLLGTAIVVDGDVYRQQYPSLSASDATIQAAPHAEVWIKGSGVSAVDRWETDGAQWKVTDRLPNFCQADGGEGEVAVGGGESEAGGESEGASNGAGGGEPSEDTARAVASGSDQALPDEVPEEDTAFVEDEAPVENGRAGGHASHAGTGEEAAGSTDSLASQVQDMGTGAAAHHESGAAWQPDAAAPPAAAGSVASPAAAVPPAAAASSATGAAASVSAGGGTSAVSSARGDSPAVGEDCGNQGGANQTGSVNAPAVGGTSGAQGNSEAAAVDEADAS